MPNQFEQFIQNIPPVTRYFLISVLVTSFLVYFDIISFVKLYLDFDDVLLGEFWRLASTFLFFGNIGLDFFLHVVFLARYSKMLEENVFYGRTIDYVVMYIFNFMMMILIALVPYLLKMPDALPIPDFLSHPFSFSIVYVWSRQNPDVQMSIFGLFNFSAPYFPWVLVGFSALIGINFFGDLLGIAVGHTYYYFAFVLPAIGGPSLLRIPRSLARAFGEVDDLQDGDER